MQTSNNACFCGSFNLMILKNLVVAVNNFLPDTEALTAELSGSPPGITTQLPGLAAQDYSLDKGDH
jgi:hypothetical protein